MLLIKNFLPFSQILWHLVFISCFNVRVCIALKNNNIQCPHWGTGNLVVVLQETWWPPNGTEIQAGPYCEHNLREILWEQWNASPAEIMHLNQWFPKVLHRVFSWGAGLQCSCYSHAAARQGRCFSTYLAAAMALQRVREPTTSSAVPPGSVKLLF